jgi:hypothetical protein
MPLTAADEDHPPYQNGLLLNPQVRRKAKSRSIDELQGKLDLPGSADGAVDEAEWGAPNHVGPKLTRLKTLKNSARNCNVSLSPLFLCPKLVSLMMAKSKLWKARPRKVFLPLNGESKREITSPFPALR